MYRFNEIPDAELIAQLPYLAQLRGEVQQQIIETAERKSLPAGRDIYFAGERAEHGFLVVGGCGRITTGEEPRKHIEYFGPGAILEDLALIGGLHHRYTATLLTNCHLLRLNGAFRKIALQDAKTLFNSMAHAQFRYQRLVERHHHNRRLNTLGRVVLALLEIAQIIAPRYVKDDSAHFPFYVEWHSQQSLAIELGICRTKVGEAYDFLRRREIICGGTGPGDPLVLPNEGCIGELDEMLKSILRSS